MRVCIDKKTGKLIGSSGGAHLETLLQNAINSGYKAEDVETKIIDDVEFAELVEFSKSPEQKAVEKNAPVKARLKQIDAESIRSIREYISTLDDAPQRIKDKEAEAITERVKLT